MQAQLDKVVSVVRSYQEVGLKVVLTNGCFDILHYGHVSCLREARELGDLLVVALNGDGSVRQLKGPSRPIFSQEARAYVLRELRAVDYVVIFDTVRATPVIEAIRPDIYVKSGDYTLETLDVEEREALERCGARIEILPKQEGFSTTSVLGRESKDG